MMIKQTNKQKKKQGTEIAHILLLQQQGKIQKLKVLDSGNKIHHHLYLLFKWTRITQQIPPNCNLDLPEYRLSMCRLSQIANRKKYDVHTPLAHTQKSGYCKYCTEN